jgi:hypothetical protein
MKLAKRQESTGSSFEENKLYVGLDEFEILAVNPDADQLAKLYGNEPKEDAKEINYVDEKDGDDRVRVTVYVKGINAQKITRINFFIVDKDRVSKDGVKKQYINQVCQTSWADSKDNLAEWFTKFTDRNKTVIGEKTFRVAMEGEGDFYDFVRAVMNKVNFNSPESEVKFNFKKMLKGDFSELNTYLTDPDWTSTFTAVWYVKNVETETGIKSYNELFSKAILPRTFYNKVENNVVAYYRDMVEEIKDDDDMFDELGIKGIKETLTPHDIYGYVKSPSIAFKDKYEAKIWENFTKNIDGEYGCKGFYKICPVFEYNASMDITASNTSHESDDASY